MMGVITSRETSRRRLLDPQWEMVVKFVANTSCSCLQANITRRSPQRIYCYASGLAGEIFRLSDDCVGYEVHRCDPCSKYYGDAISEGSGTLLFACRSAITEIMAQHLLQIAETLSKYSHCRTADDAVRQEMQTLSRMKSFNPKPLGRHF